MNRIAKTLCATCIALGAASAMAQAGGGGGPGLNSPDSAAMQPKSGAPTTATNPSATSQGNSMSGSGGNLSTQPRMSNGSSGSTGMKPNSMSNSMSKNSGGMNNNTQGTGQARTPSPQ